MMMVMSKKYIYILFSELISPLEFKPFDKDARMQETYLDLDLANKLLKLNSDLEVQKYELGYASDRSRQRRFWMETVPIRETF